MRASVAKKEAVKLPSFAPFDKRLGGETGVADRSSPLPLRGACRQKNVKIRHRVEDFNSKGEGYACHHSPVATGTFGRPLTIWLSKNNRTICSITYCMFAEDSYNPCGCLSSSRKLRQETADFAGKCRRGELKGRAQKRKSGELFRKIVALCPDVWRK